MGIASAYGYANLGKIPYGVATGGTSSSITVGGINYTLLTFTASGTLTVTEAGLFDCIIIGPGGQGGQNGGGGAGGYLEQTLYIDANQTITVGAGNHGNTSSVGTIAIAIYGGQGGSGYGFTTGVFLVGGCGGGESSQATPSKAVMNGNVGGTNSTFGGGGGGLGAVGGNGNPSVGGSGGAGKDISAWLGQTGGTTLKGGGGGAAGFAGGSGGSGGGGANGVAGTANSGGGGGSSANGGSGIVYVRFKV